ncbi:MAG: hypothetical protein ROO76_05400 [Terriglobia bacterium]|jgi:hypothetical protein|nr:hypothetical protein [Terriglobia bacterium]
MVNWDHGEENADMTGLMQRFVEAHDRYLALDCVRTDCRNPREREVLHIEILKAYLEVQHYANEIAGQQYADGMDFADQQ